ncbi:Hypothetical protein FKW44_006534, partial [Caligus rogercresseyi]
SISACKAAPSNGKFTAIEEAIKRLMDAKEKAHARYDALAELCPNDSESYEDKSIEISEKIGVLIDEADRAIVQGKEALTSTSSHASVTKEDNPRQPSQEDIIARSRKIAEEIKPHLLHSYTKMTEFISWKDSFRSYFHAAHAHLVSTEIQR